MGQINERLDQIGWNIQRSIDRMGAPYGIRNETYFYPKMLELLKERLGATVEECRVAGENFNVAVINGDPILVALAVSTTRGITQRLLRKRERYIEETGVVPARFLYVVGSIYSRRAEELRQAGFEVLEPKIDEDDRDVFPVD